MCDHRSLDIVKGVPCYDTLYGESGYSNTSARFCLTYFVLQCFTRARNIQTSLSCSMDSTGPVPAPYAPSTGSAHCPATPIRPLCNVSRLNLSKMIVKSNTQFFAVAVTHTKTFGAKRSCFVFRFSFFIFSEVSLYFVIRFSMFIFRS